MHTDSELDVMPASTSLYHTTHTQHTLHISPDKTLTDHGPDPTRLVQNTRLIQNMKWSSKHTDQTIQHREEEAQEMQKERISQGMNIKSDLLCFISIGFNRYAFLICHSTKALNPTKAFP